MGSQVFRREFLPHTVCRANRMNRKHVGPRPARVQTPPPLRRWRAGRLVLFAALVAAGCKYTAYSPTEPPLPTYTIQQLGLLAGGTQSQATAGSVAAIVGWASDAGGVHHAVTFTGGAATGLAEPAGTVSSEANSVNAAGVITGFATLGSGVQEGVVWPSPTSPPVVLPSLGGLNTFAHGINNQNSVLGTAQTDSGDTVLVTWSPGSGPGYVVARFDSAGGVDYQAVAIDDPGDLTGNLPSGQGAFLFDDDDGLLNVTPASGVAVANGMNNLGIQVGAIVNSPTQSQAYVFTGTIGPITMGGPPTGYTNVVANAVSDHGIIAGTASTVDGSGNTLTSIAVLGTVVNPAQAFTALPALGGSLSQSVGMTGCGVILGWATQSGSPAHLATAWVTSGCTLP
jgi:hypothetical protein